MSDGDGVVTPVCLGTGVSVSGSQFSGSDAMDVVEGEPGQGAAATTGGHRQLGRE